MMPRKAPFVILTPERAHRLQGEAFQAAPHALPLAAALAAGSISIALPQRRQRASLGLLERSALPVVTWLMDDAGSSTLVVDTVPRFAFAWTQLVKGKLPLVVVPKGWGHPGLRAAGVVH